MTNSIQIQVVYFAKLRELTGLDQETFSIRKGSNPTDVLESINEKHPIDIGSNFKIAVNDAFCVHRVGTLEIGETAVIVVTTSGHRDQSFKGCRYIIDEVKCRVPIWKKEHYADGETEWLKGAG